MVKFLKRWLDCRREKRRLFDLACEAFEQKYPDRDLHRNWTQIAYDKDDVLILRLCYQKSKPPRRSWWKYDDGSFIELNEQEVKQYVEIRMWR